MSCRWEPGFVLRCCGSRRGPCCNQQGVLGRSALQLYRRRLKSCSSHVSLTVQLCRLLVLNTHTVPCPTQAAPQVPPQPHLACGRHAGASHYQARGARHPHPRKLTQNAAWFSCTTMNGRRHAGVSHQGYPHPRETRAGYLAWLCCFNRTPRALLYCSLQPAE